MSFSTFGFYPNRSFHSKLLGQLNRPQAYANFIANLQSDVLAGRSERILTYVSKVNSSEFPLDQTHLTDLVSLYLMADEKGNKLIKQSLESVRGLKEAVRLAQSKMIPQHHHPAPLKPRSKL